MSTLSYLARLQADGLPWRVARKNGVGPLNLSGWFVETAQGVVVAYVGDSEDSADRAVFLAGWANTAPSLGKLITIAERSRDPELRQALAKVKAILTHQ